MHRLSRPAHTTPATAAVAQGTISWGTKRPQFLNRLQVGALPDGPPARCLPQVYSQLEGPSHVVNTAWAMLALMLAGHHTTDAEPLHRAALCLLRAQLPSGDWPQQHISGVFNRNCMITYANYR